MILSLTFKLIYTIINLIMIKLFDVNLPQITKWELKEKIVNLDPNKKHSLYWLYSEFVLRANRNSWYKKVLNESTILAIDGKGLHWSMYKAMSNDFIPTLYSNKLVYLPTIFRIFIFLVLFFIQLILNIFSGLWNLIIVKKNFTPKTLNEVILGRDFTYELLKICNLKKYKTMIIGGSNEDDEVSKNLIKKLYPDMELVLWTRKTNSLLMKDQIQNITKNPLPEKTSVVEKFLNKFTIPKPTLNQYNLYHFFPDLIEAKKAAIANKPDIILVCIGGASGKQEFFIHDLMNDDKSVFILATGLGAAIDHLGAGAKQKLPPKSFQSLGLEWLWRFFDQPYRRLRIFDSIFTLYWWTTLFQFTKDIVNKKYVALNSLIFQDSILLSNQRNFFPNSIGYTYPEVMIKQNQSIEEAGINYLNNSYKLELTPHNIEKIPEKGKLVTHNTSLRKFLFNQCYYTSDQYFINYFHVTYTPNFINPIYYINTELLPIISSKSIINPDKIQFDFN